MILKLTKKEAKELHLILSAYSDAGAEDYEGTDIEVILDKIISKLNEGLYED